MRPDVQRLFAAALELPEDQQAAFVASQTNDPEVASEVLSLLAHDRLAEPFFAETLESAAASIQLTLDLHPGARLGAYTIERTLGRGGMGAVYLATRSDGAFEHKVAIKAIQASNSLSFLRERFRQERQILARLNHPNIARLLDGGETSDGLLYFVLEYVPGQDIDRYCDSRSLSLRARLELFLQVCAAVHYAHENLVIHRDLKPGNILVGEDGAPKLLDFGVAKVLEPFTTSSGGPSTRLFTLEYASPEQIRGDAITTAADVYSLGAVLYQLLTGNPLRALQDLSPLEVVRAISEQEAPAAAGVPEEVAAILQKALHTDPARRYRSAHDFGNDMTRFLAGQPVLAVPDSIGYRVRKFAASHKRLASMLAAVFVALVAGLLATGRETIRANHERDRAAAAERSATQDLDRVLHAEQRADSERVRAQQERNRAVEEASRADTQSAAAKAVNDFLQNDLLALAGPRASVGPNTRFDPDLKVRAVLDRAAAQIAGKFDSQPLVEASLRQTIGSAYSDLGLFQEAQVQIQRALDLRRGVLGPEHPDTVSSMYALGDLDARAGRYGPAEALLNQVLEIRRRLRGDRDPDTLAAMGTLAGLAQLVQGGDSMRIEPMIKRVLDVQRSVLGEAHPDTLAMMNNLASQYVNQGKYGQAEDLYKKALNIKRRVMGEEHPSTLMSMSSLGVVYRYQGKYEEAETLLASAVKMRQRVLGAEHQESLASMRSLALLYQAEAKYPQAAPLLSEVLQTERRVLGEQHPETLATMNNVADLYRRQNQYAEAESMFNQLLAVRRRLLTADHPNITNVLASLGGMKVEQRKYAEAEPLLREALDGQRKTGADTWRRYYTESLLGKCLSGLGQYAEAEPLLLSGYKGVRARQLFMPFENRGIVDEARDSMGQLYQAWGKPAPSP